ncbi:hypothetical protein OUZ56_018623 [Daphnia magna]|uniref:Uncharacterized protein n=1 Tax=Daphnia magna TaxID=35525 RepID=A0ABQ9Z9E3_9CRUS|nr:hypothetical protein OUZ56_018623 [Daphnia magna]
MDGSREGAMSSYFPSKEDRNVMPSDFESIPYCIQRRISRTRDRDSIQTLAGEPSSLSSRRRLGDGERDLEYSEHELERERDLLLPCLEVGLEQETEFGRPREPPASACRPREPLASPCRL